MGSDFLKLWLGQTVSLLGSRVTTLALPLTAILVLHAGAAQVGLLEASGSAALSPLGVLLGGFLGSTAGLRETVVLAGAGTLLSLLPILLSPVWSLKDMPG